MPTKAWKSDSGAMAGVVVAKNLARIHGNQDNYVMADERGVTISGPVSFISGSGQIRFSGLWVMNNEISLSLPSTMATPTPVMQINPPVAQFKSLMAETVVMMGLLGSFAAL